MLFYRSIFLAFVAVSTLVDCSPIQSRASYSVKDSHHVPRKWTRVGEASPKGIVKLEIALKQSRFDELERHLYEGHRQPIRHYHPATDHSSLSL